MREIRKPKQLEQMKPKVFYFDFKFKFFTKEGQPAISEDQNL